MAPPVGSALKRSTSGRLERGSEMTDEVQVDELEQIDPEPPKMRNAWCTVKIGAMEASFDREVPAMGEATWNVAQLLADAVGVPKVMIRIEEVAVAYRDGWCRNELHIKWHILNAKAGHWSVVKFV